MVPSAANTYFNTTGTSLVDIMAEGLTEKVVLVDEPPPSYGASSYTAPSTQDTYIAFQNINFSIRQNIFTNKWKQILNDVSGVMGPGLHAIMGPTGSGKTTLLDILADRINKRGLQGTILVNGQRQPKNFKCMTGYVVQDDVVMGTLTVKENLYFSAALRLPLSVPWSEKRRRVKKIIEDLGLTACADTKIGTEFFRGVSGGERKRTNIGMELIIEPQILFLDEPTTGLDAFTAVTVTQLLKNLTQNTERIIIMSVHQPRYSIYKQFDTVSLLSRGRMVYHGLTSDVLEYFGSLGYMCETHDNPADFLLDVINKCEGQLSATSDLLAIEERNDGDGSRRVDLAEAYANSIFHNTTAEKCQQYKDGVAANGQRKKRRSPPKYATNIIWQLIVVLIRSTVNLARNPMTSILQFVIVTLFSVIVGGIYFQLDTSQNGYQNRVGAIFFIIMNQIFGNLSAIDLFIRQKHLFIHENASGFYRVSAYFIAKVVCDIIPMRILPLCLFAPITYFMIGFQIEVDKFFIYFLTLVLVSIAASSSAFWVSAGVRVAGIANLLVALTYVVQMLFGGFLITLESLPVWIRWLQYISLFRYSVEALIVNEVNGLYFNMTFADNVTVPVRGEDLLKNQGYNIDWLWYDQIGLFAMSVVFLTFTYITLRVIKKEK